MRPALFAFLAAPFLLLACDRPPSEKVKEWTPADHDRMEEQQRAMAGGEPERGAADNGQATTGAAGSNEDAEMVADTVWRQQCAACHGPGGRGDGPNGPMVNAPDLTRPDWQAKVTDEQLVAILKNGKGKMPRFDLPDGVTTALVARVRAAGRANP